MPHQRLLNGLPTLEEEAVSRAPTVAERVRTGAPTQDRELRGVISAALEYGVTAVELGENGTAPIPTTLLVHARQAARDGVCLDVSLRRYASVQTVLVDCLLREVEYGELVGGQSLNRLIDVQATAFDRLAAAVSREYVQEAGEALLSSEDGRRERVEQLLADENLSTSRIPYDFDLHHLAIVARGAGGEEAIEDIARSLELPHLLIRAREGAIWAWLGHRGDLAAAEVEASLRSRRVRDMKSAVGEPAHGLAGWRLTHHQARTALPVALQGPEPIVRYADVALLASLVRDELLATSMRRLYLEPLEAERDGGEELRRTLRAYFDADRNVSEAAAAIGITRQAVARRLRTAEERLGRPFSTCGAELELALRYDDLEPTPLSAV